MFFNYLKIAVRSIWKNPRYSFISISGLSLGVTVSVLIMLFIVHELNYDRFHSRRNNIFRMKAEINYGGQVIQTTSMSAAFGPLLANASANVRSYVRLREPGRVVLSHGSDKFFEDKFIFADTTFFSVFDFPWQEGRVAAFAQPGKVLITPAAKQKYFGDEEAIGKTVTYQNSTELEIVGVVSAPPSNSSLQFEWVASFSTLGLLADENERSQYLHDRASLGSYPTFLLLNDPSKVADLEAAIPKLANTSVDEKYSLLPLQGQPANFGYLKIFGSVATLVLLLALVNYVNLTTARASIRAKEVCVRKVVGAHRKAIARQFYLESTLLTIIAFVCAYLLVSISLPFFLQTIGQRIDSSFLTSPQFVLFVVLLFVFCVVMAAGYPAFVLSRFSPAQVLKGKPRSLASGAWVRKGLTTVQFAVSVALIVCSIVVQDQLTFLRNQKIGLQRDQVLVVNLEGLGSSYRAFRNEVKALSNVASIGQASVSMYKDGGMAGFFLQTPKTNEDVFMNVLTADPDFFQTLGIEWAFNEHDSLQSGDWVTNEAGLAKLKLSPEDLGISFKLMRDTIAISAVTKDFNYGSLREKVGGLLINVADDSKIASEMGSQGSIYVRLNTGRDIYQQVAQIRELYNRYQPTAPFEYYFLDDAFNSLYQSEDRLALVFKTFTALAIGIACLGLFGLVTFTTERKTKEIGIRKVLGASVRSILALISSEFTGVLVTSLIVAGPVAWWAMERWLAEFPYRIQLSPWVFVTAAAGVAVLAWATILTQAVHSAAANPVDSLRKE